MARPLSRASQAKLDALHGLVAETLVKQIKKAHKADEPVSAAVLSTAISLLKLTDTASPRQAKKKDRLAGLLKQETERDEGQSHGQATPRPINPLADFRTPADPPSDRTDDSLHDLRERDRRSAELLDLDDEGDEQGEGDDEGDQDEGDEGDQDDDDFT